MTDTKKNTENAVPMICPLCGQEYTDRPALSREDNATLICPTCGTRQALRAMGTPEGEIERIIQAIYTDRSF